MTFYTDRQVAVLEFLQRYQRMAGKAPTLSEISEHFGVSKVTVHDHIRQLEAKGAVRKAPHRARALEILDPDYIDPDPAQGTTDGILPLTVLGRIAAGQPIDAIESPETIDLADLLPMGRDHYALRVCGDSMIEDGIHDGDLVIIERRSSADDGETVVAILDGEEATLKRLYREKVEGRSVFRLQPANSTMAPIYAESVEVRGVVIGVVRKYPAS
ncbi:MAG: transcriptional repressor LexA [Planctomycetota bacterium]|jgi:repressor LexA